MASTNQGLSPSSGGTLLVIKPNKVTSGLSPRGRGNRHPVVMALAGVWSIPAWAGEPVRIGDRPCKDTVYPRVGGGTRRYAICPLCTDCLSPRGRGEPGIYSCVANIRSVYPRVGGGTTDWQMPGGQRPLSIPAWAGEPASYGRAVYRLPVYPRVGGGTLVGEYWQLSIISPADYRYLTRYTPSASTICFGDSPSVLISCSLTADGSLHVITTEPCPNW